MLFLTIVFLTYSLVVLINGKLFKGLRVESLEEEIKKAKQGTDNYKFENIELGIKSLLFALFFIPFLILELIYLTKAIVIDPLYYPSVAALSYFLLAVVISLVFKNKKDLSTDEKIDKARKKAKKGRSFKGFLLSLIWVIYFGYMAYTLVV